MDDIKGLTSDDAPTQPASQVTGWHTRSGDGGWRKVRASKTFERSDNAPSAEPQTRLDRLGGCNGPVKQLVKEGEWLVMAEEHPIKPSAAVWICFRCKRVNYRPADHCSRCGSTTLNPVVKFTCAICELEGEGPPNSVVHPGRCREEYNRRLARKNGKLRTEKRRRAKAAIGGQP